MQRLQEVNLQKCIDTLESFHRSIPSGIFDGSLDEKKRRAEQSLEQLKVLFHPPRMGVGCGDPGQCKGGTHEQTGNNLV